jgi:hypothetical protein
VQWTAATQARYLAVKGRSRRGFNPNDFVFCRAVRASERCRLGIGHNRRIVYPSRETEAPKRRCQTRRKHISQLNLARQTERNQKNGPVLEAISWAAGHESPSLGRRRPIVETRHDNLPTESRQCVSQRAHFWTVGSQCAGRPPLTKSAVPTITRKLFDERGWLPITPHQRPCSSVRSGDRHLRQLFLLSPSHW